MKKKIYIFFLFCLPGAFNASGQSAINATINGRVIEGSTKEPMEFVNVILFEALEKEQRQGTVTGKEGEFHLNAVPPGDYFLEISFIGFETKRTSDFTFTGAEDKLELGDLAIEINSKVLKEVEVTAEKLTYELSIDRKIYNVEKDLMSQTGSATDILQNIPSVSVDVDGQVSLRGTSNITYFINGKPSALMRANPTAALLSMPANTIERIEVITNPSAKYRPDGVGGIINIVLKKESREGGNGTLLANIGNPDRYQANITLNYGTPKWNAFGSYGFRYRQTPKSIRETRINKDGDGGSTGFSEYETKESKKSFSHIVNAGLTFPIGDRSQVEISGNYYSGSDDVSSFSQWRVEEETTTSFTIDRQLDEPEEEFEISASFEHEFEKSDQTIVVEVNHARYKEMEDNYFDTKYTRPYVSTSLSHYLIEKGGPLTEVSVEYARSVGEDSELEAGYVAEFLTDDLRNFGEDLDPDLNAWVTDPNKTNQFIFNQNIHAGYLTFNHTIGNFGFLAGLRAEEALINSRLLTTNTIIPNNYFKLYPSLHFSYALGENQKLQLNYSKRVNRADSDEHNPFPEYKDPRNREAGNPQLKPEQIHSIELGYHLQQDNFSFIPSIYYRHKYDAFAEIQEIVEDSILHTTYTNLNTENSAGLEMIFTGNVGEMLRLMFSATAFYQELDASNLGFTDKRSAVSWNSKLAANWNITRSTFAQLNAYYRSARISPQGEYQPLFLLNLGMRQDVLKKKASITLTVSDVFASLEWRSLIDTPTLYRNRKYKRNQQIIYLGFTYRFGGSFKNEQEHLNFEDNI